MNIGCKKRVFTICRTIVLIQISILVALMLLTGTAAGEDFFRAMPELYESRNFDELERRAKQEISSVPDSLEAHYFLIATRLFNAEYEQAIPLMDKFAMLHNKMEDREKKKFGLPSTTEYVHNDVRFVGLYYEIGKYRLEQKLYKDARKWFQRARSVYAKEPMLNFYLGITNMELGNYEEAVKHFELQFELAPDEPSPLYNIACVYARQGRSEDAVDWLAKAIQKHEAFKEQAKKDNDFDKVKNTPQFKSLVFSTEE